MKKMTADQLFSLIKKIKAKHHHIYDKPSVSNSIQSEINRFNDKTLRAEVMKEDREKRQREGRLRKKYVQK